jgi:hypothetical protein
MADEFSTVLAPSGKSVLSCELEHAAMSARDPAMVVMMIGLGMVKLFIIPSCRTKSSGFVLTVTELPIRYESGLVLDDVERCGWQRVPNLRGRAHEAMPRVMTEIYGDRQ